MDAVGPGLGIIILLSKMGQYTADVLIHHFPPRSCTEAFVLVPRKHPINLTLAPQFTASSPSIRLAAYFWRLTRALSASEYSEMLLDPEKTVSPWQAL